MEINFDSVTNYTRGLPTLDKRFGMPGKRELIILFGYPASGKTEFSYFAARKNAEKGNKVLFISLELPEYDMKLRIARKRAGVNKFDFQSKNYTPQQQKIMEEQFKKIDTQENLSIVSPEDKSLGSIIKLLRKGYDQGYKMYMIDNLDKIWGNEREDENSRYQRITTALQDFKNENDACIILLHHAKKADGKGISYKPAGVSGMRGSQKIMDNATQVIEVYRDLDPDCAESDRNKVMLTQMKDTFEGANGFVDIFFGKGDYHVENPSNPL